MDTRHPLGESPATTPPPPAVSSFGALLQCGEEVATLVVKVAPACAWSSGLWQRGSATICTKNPFGTWRGSVWVKSQKTCVYAFLNVNYPQSHVLPWSHGGLRMCEIAPSPHPPASMPFTMLLHARGVQPAGRGQHDGAALDTKDQGQQEHLASRLTCRTTRKLGLHVFWWDVFHQQWAVVLCTLQTAIRTPLPGSGCLTVPTPRRSSQKMALRQKTHKTICSESLAQLPSH